MINFEVLMEVTLLWFASPERHLLCAHISGLRFRNCGCSQTANMEQCLCCNDFPLCSKHECDIVFLSCFPLFQAMVAS